MKVKDVIARLQAVNPEAEFEVIALNQSISRAVAPVETPDEDLT